MQHPIHALRDEHNLTRAAFARVIGVSYHQVASIELGHPRDIPKTWAQGLEALGQTYSRLNQAYHSWRSADALDSES